MNYDLIENSSIANFLTLRSFRLFVLNFEGKNFSSKINRFIGNLGYSLFKPFSNPPAQYRFDHTVIHLENLFKTYTKQGKHHILRLLYPIYIFVCVFAVWFFSMRDTKVCGDTMSKYSYIMYAVFGLVTFFTEAIIFSKVL